MPNVKTAISVEKTVFDQMDMLARKLNVSRSRLFAMAAREFIQRHKNSEIFDLINQAYDDLPESETLVAKMRSKHFDIVKDQW